MVAFTITPSRAAARLNSGVRHFYEQLRMGLLQLPRHSATAWNREKRPLLNLRSALSLSGLADSHPPEIQGQGLGGFEGELFWSTARARFE